jgi:RimJ/RimL family protein N-acetyltransferase
MKYLLNNTSSKRLDYRLVKESDFDTWLPLFSDPDAAKFLALDTTKSPQELCEFWFQKVFHRYDNNLGGMNALIEKESGKFVGQCGLLVQTVEGEERLEIGYSILPSFRGKGYASEAAQHCKLHAFKNQWANELISIVHTENVASQQVAVKNGMQFEKQVEEYKGILVNVFKVIKEDDIS